MAPQKGLSMETCISSQGSFWQSEIYEIAARIANSHQITAHEQHVLRTAFLENALEEEEHRIVNRLYRALRRGRIKVV